MYDFKVGQKVKCVRPTDDLVKGKTYTITKMNDLALVDPSDRTGGKYFIWLDGIREEYWANRFEALTRDPMVRSRMATYLDTYRDLYVQSAKEDADIRELVKLLRSEEPL